MVAGVEVVARVAAVKATELFRAIREWMRAAGYGVHMATVPLLAAFFHDASLSMSEKQSCIVMVRFDCYELIPYR